MKRKPYFLTAAWIDYHSAKRWYRGQRPGLDTAFAVEVNGTLERACNQPHRFPRVRGPVRRIRVNRFPYVIYFLDWRERLIVLAVFHLRRNPAIWQRRG